MKRLGKSTEDGEKMVDPPEAETIPTDFELVAGSGEKQRIFQTWKVMLTCYLPGFGGLVGDMSQATRLELPDLDPDAMQIVLDVFTTRESADLPRSWEDSYDHVQEILGKCGLPRKKTANDEPIVPHPALVDPRWLDATFVVGPEKEEVKANRVVLGLMNPVFRRILFGTGLITVDPLKPIEWPEFTVGAVRQVLLALVQRGKDEVVVPIEDVESAMALVDYLMESPTALNLFYDTPFERDFLDGFTAEIGFDGIGLKERQKPRW